MLHCWFRLWNAKHTQQSSVPMVHGLFRCCVDAPETSHVSLLMCCTTSLCFSRWPIPQEAACGKCWWVGQPKNVLLAEVLHAGACSSTLGSAVVCCLLGCWLVALNLWQCREQVSHNAEHRLLGVLQGLRSAVLAYIAGKWLCVDDLTYQGAGRQSGIRKFNYQGAATGCSCLQRPNANSGVLMQIFIVSIALDCRGILRERAAVGTAGWT